MRNESPGRDPHFGSQQICRSPGDPSREQPVHQHHRRLCSLSVTGSIARTSFPSHSSTDAKSGRREREAFVEECRVQGAFQEEQSSDPHDRRERQHQKRDCRR